MLQGIPQKLIHDFVTIYPGVSTEPNVEIFEGAVVGKPPSPTKAISRPILSNNGEVFIGKNCVIGAHAVIYQDCVIGEDTLIGDGAYIREGARIGKRCVIARITMNYNTTIGDDTKIMNLAVITGNMVIGSHVFIGPHVATVNDNSLGKSGYNEVGIKGPTIEDYARIGAGAILLPAVRIGAHALVGAGSVVTRDVPPGKVVMGAPARIVKDVQA